MREILREQVQTSTAEMAIRQQTPARVFVGRSGPAYRTATQLELRRDHAAARDAVEADLILARDFAPEVVDRWALFAVSTAATSKREFLLRPDLGRRLSDEGRRIVASRCPTEMDIQFIVGDGLSAIAAIAQVPSLLPALFESAKKRGWVIGQPFIVERCRVGVLNDVGDLLQPKVAMLLVGERPGLATAESLSIYMAFRPKSGQTDADRNLISNIHARGVPVAQAAERAIALAEQMMRQATSGVAVKEIWRPELLLDGETGGRLTASAKSE